jgi:hypothetical protein
MILGFIDWGWAEDGFFWDGQLPTTEVVGLQSGGR